MKKFSFVLLVAAAIYGYNSTQQPSMAAGNSDPRDDPLLTIN